jgi:predicted MPP superfamily phosphohydrolase
MQAAGQGAPARPDPSALLDDRPPSGEMQFGVISRRQFFGRNASLVMAVAAAECISEATHIETLRYTVPLTGLKSPIRVVQLTDLHRSIFVTEAYIARVVRMANALQPDLVLLTGDFISYDTCYLPSCLRHIAKLNAPLGLYAVLGNHDYAADAYTGGPKIAEGLRRIGVHMLIDRSTKLANGIRLIGLDDVTTQAPCIDAGFQYALPDEPTIVMTHNPQLWSHELQHRDCLTVCGHTHGGQINLPLITEIVHPDRTWFLKGWFRRNGLPGRLYVSRGLGVVNVPMRFRSRPELTVFDLVPA